MSQQQRNKRPIIHVGQLFDRQPPQQPEAEAALLGAMILDGSIVPDVSRAIGRERVFYSDHHDMVYRAILRTWDRNQGAVNLVNLVAEIRRSAEVSGAEFDENRRYLSELAKGTPGPATWPYMVRAIRDAAQRRKLIEACGQIVFDAYSDAEVESLCHQAVERVGEAARREGRTGEYITVADAAAEALLQVQSQTRETFKTGLDPFDTTWGGVPKKLVTVIKGTQSAGKSTLALQWLRTIAEAGTPCAVFSFEMQPARIASHWMTQMSGSQVHRHLMHGTLPDAEGWRKLEEAKTLVGRLPIIFHKGNPHALDIYSACVTYRERGVKAILVDYIQNLPPMPGITDTVERIERSAQTLQRIAVELGMAVLVVSQRTASSNRESGRPNMGDARGSGAITDVADMLLTVWRPNMGKARKRNQSPESFKADQERTVLIVHKCKYGQPGQITCRFDGGRLRFVPKTVGDTGASDYDDDEDEGGQGEGEGEELPF